jgi:LPS O-antigen subunit length determinant protein (WzzB/FepE family)
MSDGVPKSSFELAMERLRQKDAAAGVTAKPLTDAQKAAIAEVRSLYDSKIAEQDVLQQSAMKNLAGADPAEVDEISRRFRRERERLTTERDSKIEALRESR